MATGLTQEQLTQSVNAYLEQMERERAARLEAAPEVAQQIREILLPHFAAWGFRTVVITYDGYGDQGNIEWIVAVDKKGDSIPADSPIWTAHLDTADDPRWTEGHYGGKLRNVLEDIGDWLLDLHCDGFENGEGGFGEIRLEIESGTIAHDHSQRRYVTDDESFEL